MPHKVIQDTLSLIYSVDINVIFLIDIIFPGQKAVLKQRETLTLPS